jgi:hypothetical protein
MFGTFFTDYQSGSARHIELLRAMTPEEVEVWWILVKQRENWDHYAVSALLVTLFWG